MDPLGNPSETPRGHQTTRWEPAMAAQGCCEPAMDPLETLGPQTTLWEPDMDPLGNPSGTPRGMDPLGNPSGTPRETPQGPSEVPKPHFGNQPWTPLGTSHGPPWKPLRDLQRFPNHTLGPSYSSTIGCGETMALCCHPLTKYRPGRVNTKPVHKQ